MYLLSYLHIERTMYISKKIFVLSFINLVTGNFSNIKQMLVETQNIIGELHGHTITSCVMKCQSNKHCVTIGLMTDPDLFVRHHCYLLKKNSTNTKKNSNLQQPSDTKSLFVLLTVSLFDQFLIYIFLFASIFIWYFLFV